MKIIAYLYADPLLESLPSQTLWGWEVDVVYVDLAVTTPLQPRPQLARLLMDAQNSPPDYLLLRRLDELGDSLATVGETLQAIEALGTVVIAIEQEYRTIQEAAPQPLQNPFMILLAEVQRSQRSRRIRQGHARNRVKALPPPGKAPYGYRRGKDRYTLDRSTAPVVKEFFEQFILYGSLRGAVRYLARRYGKKIAVSTGRRWLENPVYRGNTAYSDGRVIPDTHGAIISPEEAAQVDRLLRRNRQLAPRTASAPRSLAGLVTCETCGSGMKVSRVTTPRKKTEYLYLRPTACPNQPKCKAIAYDGVLMKTIETICTELPKAVAQLQRPPMERIKGDIADQIQQKKKILEQVSALVASGLLDQETADLRTYRLQTEIAEIQQQLAALPPVNLQELTQAVAIPQFWQDLSEAERRFFFREFIKQIQLVREEETWALRLVFIF
jgi:DNA invertase Pin-like site-specific DNA recombinase